MKVVLIRLLTNQDITIENLIFIIGKVLHKEGCRYSWSNYFWWRVIWQFPMSSIRMHWLEPCSLSERVLPKLSIRIILQLSPQFATWWSAYWFSIRVDRTNWRGRLRHCIPWSVSRWRSRLQIYSRWFEWIQIWLHVCWHPRIRSTGKDYQKI